MEYVLTNPLHATIGTEKYQCKITWRNGTFISDEPEFKGGKDAGPDPYSLLLSSLVGCTLVTLRMYIDRKGWDIPEIAINANLFFKEEDGKKITVIDRDVDFITPIDDERKEHLLHIVKVCPVSKILEGEIQVRSFIIDKGDKANTHSYTNGDVTVEWRPELCKHAARCATQLPSVFDPSKKPWVNMDGATSKEITDQVNKCPTGALRMKGA